MADARPEDLSERIAQIHRDEYAIVVASLARRFGDLDIAEEAAGEAFVAVLEKWPEDGVPPNPGGWLTTTANRKAIDRIRRESHREAKYQQALMITDDSPAEPTGPVQDDRLRLIFTCAHPALAPEARVALTLRLIAGLGTTEIARAFLLPERTLAQRLTRAKRKIKDTRIPYRVPDGADLAPRLGAVLDVVHLIFNEGYLATSGDDPIRGDLTAEAIRLGRLLHHLLPEHPETSGLLALMLLTESRRAARLDAAGRIVALDHQIRSRWDRALIAEGHALVRSCLALGQPGRYQLHAAINAVHTDAPSFADTDWSQIAALYGQLYALHPSPVVALNRAIAIAELDGPAVALAEVERLGSAHSELEQYTPWQVTRADLLARVGRVEESRAAYDRAIGLSENEAEREFLRAKRDRLG